jgi:DNA-binding transcriptional ArsR family regulator
VDFRDHHSRPTDHRLIRALENPIAIRILELAMRAPSQGFTASQLRDDLADDFGDLEVRQVAYHLSRLQDDHLLPRSIGGP